MPPHRDTPGSAADWLARARGDLAIAKAPLPAGAFYEDLCFHAQQAAEKGLKAICQHNGWAFRYTHDLDTLFSVLREHGLNVPEEIAEVDTLTAYAAGARYPGFDEPVTKQEYQQAVSMAEKVLAWAEDQIK